MATVAELRQAALLELGLIEAGSEPSAEDATFVDRRIERKVAELTETENVTFTTSAIPDEVMTSLTKIVAAEIAPGFSYADTARISYLAQSGLRDFRRVIARLDPAPEKPVKLCYY